MNLDLVIPLFVQVAMTILLIFVTGGARYFAVKSGEVKVKEIVLGQRAWPKKLQQLGNTLNNQWETPILFYAGIGFALILGSQSPWLVPLAWAWIGLRLLHAVIYISVNHLLFRFLAFACSVLALTGFWVALALEFLTR